MRFAGYVIIIAMVALLFGSLTLFRAGVNQKEYIFKRVPAPFFRITSAFYEPLLGIAKKLKGISHASAVIDHSKELGFGPWNYVIKAGKFGIVSTDYSRYQKLVLYARIETGIDAKAESKYSCISGIKRLVREVKDYGSFFLEYQAGYCIITSGEYQNFSKEEAGLNDVFALTEKTLGDFVLRSVTGNGAVALCDDVELSQNAETIFNSYHIEKLPLRFFLTAKKPAM